MESLTWCSFRYIPTLKNLLQNHASTLKKATPCVQLRLSYTQEWKVAEACVSTERALTAEW